MSLLRIEGLRLSIHGTEILKGVSLELRAGEVFGLVGESGSGKSLTAFSLMRLLPDGARLDGSAWLGESELLSASETALCGIRGREIGMIFQEPMTALNPVQTIGDQVAEALVIHGVASREDALRVAREKLDRVGLTAERFPLDRYPHELSGGQRQRVCIAMAIALRPKLLIADEPTTALDTLSQAEVLSLMMSLTAESGTAVMLITHNLGLVARYADRAVVMHRGEIVETGAAAELLADPRQDYTRRLVEALPRRGPPRPERPAVAPLIEAQNLRVAFAGRRRFLRRLPYTEAVKGVNLAIRPGEVVALVGGWGSGKTTLGRAMLRLVNSSGGEILYRNQPITAAKGSELREFRQNCQIIFQDPYSSLDPRMRIGAILAEALRFSGLSASEVTTKVEAALSEVSLPGLGQRFPHELSGGQRQRVAIARALIRRPDFVLADEPVSALDMTIQKQVLTLLRDLQAQRGFSCLFVSHDLAAVEEIADRVVVMHRGGIVEEGSRDQIFDAPRHDYTKALLAASPRL